MRTWGEFRFLPRVAESVAQLNMAGYLVFVVTNQAIVNRGHVSRKQVEEINDRMVEEIGKRGGRITEVLYCPHRPEELCQCRKPNPGLLYEAAAKYSLDLKECFLVGDAVSDVAAGLTAGCRNFLVFTGRGWRQFLTSTARRHHGYRLARNLEDAVRAILKEGKDQEMVPGLGLALACGEESGVERRAAGTAAANSAGGGGVEPLPVLRTYSRPILKVQRQFWSDGSLIDELLDESFARGRGCSLRVVSGSMRPVIEPGDTVLARKTDPSRIRIGDIVAFRTPDFVVVHRIIGAYQQGGRYYFRERGDSVGRSEVFPEESLLGRVTSVEKKGGSLDLESLRWRLANRLLGWSHRLGDALERKRLRRYLPGTSTVMMSFERHMLEDWSRGGRSKCVDPVAGKTLSGG